jgi:hypothetical protein
MTQYLIFIDYLKCAKCLPYTLTHRARPSCCYILSALCICLLLYYLSQRKDEQGTPCDIVSTLLKRKTQSLNWTVRGSNPGGGDVFRSRSDRSWDPTSLLYNGYQVSIPGVKRPGRGVDDGPQVALRFYKEQIYISTLLRAFMTCSRVNFTFYFNTQSDLPVRSNV